MLMLLAVPSDVQGFGSQGQLWTGAGAANINSAAPTAAGWWGPTLAGGLVVDVGDFWRLTADAGVSHHFQRTVDDTSQGPHTVVSTAVGARYALDIITYVPYIGLAGVVHPMGAPTSTAPDGELFSLRATVGLDYRINRQWSLGAAVDLHLPVTEPGDAPHYSSAGLHIGYHFRRF